MKKAALAALLTVSLAGCASLPHPTTLVHRHHKVAAAAPAPVPAPVVIPAPVEPPALPPTFSERFRAHWKRLRWVH